MEAKPRPICNRCNERLVAFKGRGKFRAICEKCRDANLPPLDLAKRPTCSSCGNNPVVFKTQKRWGKECSYCLDKKYKNKSQVRMMCVVCNKRLVSPCEQARWRNKCWKCNNPSRKQRNSSDRRRLRAKILTPCVRCGTTENIHIDHKDGDNGNDAIENLQCLCRNCHKLKTIENKEYLPLEKRKIEMSA